MQEVIIESLNDYGVFLEEQGEIDVSMKKNFFE